jgi:hypothetical protein
MVLLDNSFADALPLLFDFLGVADPQRPAPRLDPEARQRQIIAVMRGRPEGPPTPVEQVTPSAERVHWVTFLARLRR